MKLPQSIPVLELASSIGAEVFGDKSLLAIGINEIHKVESGDICFVDHPKYYEKCLQSAATIILIDKAVDVPSGKAIMVLENPFRAYNELILRYRPFRALSSVIDPSAQIHPSAIIEPNVVIGPDCQVGEGSVIQAGVVIQEHCIIGRHCLIQSGVMIGSDAFYYKKQHGKYSKWRSGGRVVIHDYVDIGSNCTINRGVSSDTIIGEGTKLDCLVHVGHGTVIGKNCLVAAQVGIAGKCQIGDEVTIYGQAGVANNTVMESGTVILAQSGVNKILKKGTYFGSPGKDARVIMKEMAYWKELPWMYRSLKKLLNKS